MKRTRLARPVVRPATQADILAFYKKPLQQTVIAKVGVVRGRIIGCGGVAYIDGKAFVFFDLKPSARRYKVTIVKAAKQVIDEVRANGCRVMWADLDPDEVGAERWARSLGFEPTLKARLYRWQSGQ